jgi:hypothetical protein
MRAKLLPCLMLLGSVACTATPSARGPRAERPTGVLPASGASSGAGDAPRPNTPTGAPPDGTSERPPAEAPAVESGSSAREPGPSVEAPRATEPPSGEADARLAERAAYEAAKPVFEAHCGRCHAREGAKSSKGTLRHFSMDSYPFGGHHAHELTKSIRHVLGVDGRKPTMPRDAPGSVKGRELDLILAWAEASDRAQAHEGAADHTHGSHAH